MKSLIAEADDGKITRLLLSSLPFESNTPLRRAGGFGAKETHRLSHQFKELARCTEFTDVDAIFAQLKAETGYVRAAPAVIARTSA